MKKRVVFDLIVLDQTVHTVRAGKPMTALGPYSEFRGFLTPPFSPGRRRIIYDLMLRLIVTSDTID